ncbi:MFS transporter [Nocardia vermiculata]|uniref:Putative proline/betaine transporter n=1 Tax=Nocardia vermiculata TaxID=257274 RepID=A0A846Y4S7_9NOCA|nr:MFS transporter [Nocardia vermiculata]NKY53847.1 MHS family MFS transporter [Nocardia vermiculata]
MDVPKQQPAAPTLPDSAVRASATDTTQLRKVALSSLLGTVLEYYDFLLYGTMAALVFGDIFFPSSNHAASTVAAFGTLAAGYVARPVGGLVFGHFGDRLGRKSMLIITMVMMGGASFLIGVLPDYRSIGVLAPVLLVALRVIQGVAIGGEWGGAALMVIEHADDDRRGRWVGIMQLGSPLGSLLSTVVVMAVTVLPDDSLYSWGWRIPFLLAGVLVAVGLYVRLGVVESPVFREAVAKADAENATAAPKTPLAQLLRRPGPLLVACAAGIGPFALTALATSHIIAYATDNGYDSSQVMPAVAAVAALSLITIPLFSALSDRLGRRSVILAGAVGAVVFAFPMYALVNTGSQLWLLVSLLIAQVVQNMMYAPLAPLLAEMFGTENRYTGVSLGYQTASLIGAGFGPLIASSLLASTGGSSVSLSLIIVVAALVTAIAVRSTAETRGRDLNTEFIG